MTATQALAAKAAPRTALRIAWLPGAAVLLGNGWGSNQFTPMLLVYRHTLGLGTGTLEAMFGLYALGLIPGLLVAGPLSDARGRRAVVVPATALSLVASLALAAAAYSAGFAVTLLFAGRLLAGVSNGAIFAAGTAWLRELSSPPLGNASVHTAARRAAIAMTTGFALGPLVAGLLAQWVPAPGVTAYLPHIALTAAVLALLRNAGETVSGGTAGTAPRGVRRPVPGTRSPRFRRVVMPMAPWIFAAPAIAFALLPSIVRADRAADGIVLTAAITALCALAGVLVQPLARRLDASARGNLAATAGLLVMAAGLILAAVTASAQQVWLLVPCSIVFGSAYGLCLVAGLVEIQRIAGQRGLAGLTALYYALAYLGFAAPYLITAAAHVVSYPVLLTIGAALALSTAMLVTRGSRQSQDTASAPHPHGGHQ